MLKELLDDIIAENILHELDSVRLDLSKDLFLLIAIRRLELLLDEPGTVLVAAEFHNMMIDVLAAKSAFEVQMTSDECRNHTLSS